MPDERPFSRNVSPIITVDGESFDGPCKVEIQRAEWLNKKTGRYGVMWSARKEGRLGWDAAKDLRSAISRACFVSKGTRPRWLATAVREARERLS